MKNSYRLGKYDLPHIRHLFICHPLSGLKIYSIKTFEQLLYIQQGYPYINDVWDGRNWKSFNRDNCENCFFKNIHNVAFIMNVDWFKPYKHSEYKVGGIYLNILNLPRTQRYKTKWTMLIGLIPGPTEPKDNNDSFLKPLVNDLIELWNGIQIHCSSTTTLIRGALIAVSCDIPAARKYVSFLVIKPTRDAHVVNLKHRGKIHGT